MGDIKRSKKLAKFSFIQCPLLYTIYFVSGDEGDDEMYHEDHQHHGNEGGHHDGEPQFGEEHHKPEEHHPGELHNGAGQEGKDFHEGTEITNQY